MIFFERYQDHVFFNDVRMEKLTSKPISLNFSKSKFHKRLSLKFNLPRINFKDCVPGMSVLYGEIK